MDSISGNSLTCFSVYLFRSFFPSSIYLSVSLSFSILENFCFPPCFCLKDVVISTFDHDWFPSFTFSLSFAAHFLFFCDTIFAIFFPTDFDILSIFRFKIRLFFFSDRVKIAKLYFYVWFFIFGRLIGKFVISMLRATLELCPPRSLSFCFDFFFFLLNFFFLLLFCFLF